MLKIISSIKAFISGITPEEKHVDTKSLPIEEGVDNEENANAMAHKASAARAPFRVSENKFVRAMWDILDSYDSNKDKRFRIIVSLLMEEIRQKWTSTTDRKMLAKEIEGDIYKMFGITHKASMKSRGILGKAEEMEFERNLAYYLYDIEGFAEVPAALREKSVIVPPQERSKFFNDILSAIAPLCSSEKFDGLEKMHQKNQLIKVLEKWLPDVEKIVEAKKIAIDKGEAPATLPRPLTPRQRRLMTAEKHTASAKKGVGVKIVATPKKDNND